MEESGKKPKEQDDKAHLARRWGKLFWRREIQENFHWGCWWKQPRMESTTSRIRTPGIWSPAHSFQKERQSDSKSTASQPQSPAILKAGRLPKQQSLPQEGVKSRNVLRVNTTEGASLVSERDGYDWEMRANNNIKITLPTIPQRRNPTATPFCIRNLPRLPMIKEIPLDHRNHLPWDRSWPPVHLSIPKEPDAVKHNRTIKDK